MSLADRFTETLATHSIAILCTLLVVTAALGAGAPLVDDDSSLEQFETDSPEAEALEEIDDTYTGGENTTSIQLIATEGNVLERESLLRSIELQQTLRDTDSINETLEDEEAITGVETLLAITAMTNEEIEELEDRGDELADDAQALEDDAEELEDRADVIEAEAEALEERGEELEAEGVELEERGEALEAEAAEVEERGEGLEAEAAEVEERGAALEAQGAALEAQAADPTTETDPAEIAAQQAALEDEQEQLEADQAALEAEQEQLEADQAALAEAGEELEADSEALEEETEELEADGEELEAEAEALEDEAETLEERGEELEDEQEQLDEDWEDVGPEERPSLEDQHETLATIDEDAFETAIEDTLEDDPDNETPALSLMGSEYEPESTTADARMTSISQELEGEAELGAADDEIIESQLEIRELAEEDDEAYVVFGAGVITDEIDRSMADSLTIVGPLAILFIIATLFIAYRDPLDIALGVAGIVAVLLWTFGFMGWAGIAFNQMFVAVPVLLIGLSIDYAIHVFMRHRERRTGKRAHGTETVGGSMAVALAGVGVALLWVTATTAIGFLANLVSPIAPIREFGLVSAVGIVSALFIFGALIPAAKIELDSRLEVRGFDRRRRAFGTGGGRFSTLLSTGAVAARNAPLVIVLLVLLSTTAGVYGATQVDTSFDEEDFLAESPPDWTQSLPEPFAPGEYQAKADLDFVNENFQREDAQAQILIRGEVTDDETLARIDAAEAEAAESPVTYTLASGEADVDSPLSAMDRVAADNESFEDSFEEADTTGDGVPDSDLEGLYDELYEVDEDIAETVIYRTDDGEYESVRMVIATDGEAGFDEITEEMRELAAGIESGAGGAGGAGGDGGTEAGASDTEADAGGGGDGTGDGATSDSGGDTAGDEHTAAQTTQLTAIATGDPIVNHLVEGDLLETVFESLAITLIAVFVFLTVAYWLTGNGATLGAVTLLPVAFAVAWILGTMYLIGMPFNVLTGMITSLTIGLGVAYSIHISARYTLELERQGNVWEALETTVTGTGGALAGSAATTVGGFGVLAFAILPVLRQFGIITAMTITYAFLASVVVLPTLLVGWTRYLGPDVSFDRQGVGSSRPAASDGGQDTVEGED